MDRRNIFKINQVSFTVITVCYNSGQFIKEAISSVLSQSYQHFEYIILDDNSSDSSWQIINSFDDPRIKAYRNKTNLGEYKNRNKAIELASGDYVIFLDGDDFMYYNALETFIHYTQQFPECAMVFTREWDPRILYPFKADPEMLYKFEFLDGGLMGGNFTKVLFKKEALINAGYLPTDIATGDTYIQLKIALTQSGLAINDGLTWWRRRSGNATDKFFKNNRHHAETINYRIAFLNDLSCPLNKEEKERAKHNLYGLYLRSLMRMILKLQLRDVGFLLRRIKIPAKYYRSIFIPSQHNYYQDRSGDNPFNTIAAPKQSSLRKISQSN